MLYKGKNIRRKFRVTCDCRTSALHCKLALFLARITSSERKIAERKIRF